MVDKSKYCVYIIVVILIQIWNIEEKCMQVDSRDPSLQRFLSCSNDSSPGSQEYLLPLLSHLQEYHK